jgi:hypothetical protein
MRTFPVALLEVGARVSDLFTTVLARHRDMLIFRHVARITETCLECMLGSAEGEKQCARAQLSVNCYRLLVICYRKQEATARSGGSFFDGAVDVSQVIAKRVTGIGCSLLQVTGEIQLRTQRAASLDCFCLLPFPFPNGAGS